MQMLSENLITAVEDPSNEAARGMMLLAASFAGIGFVAGAVDPHCPHEWDKLIGGKVAVHKAFGWGKGKGHW